MKQEVGGHDRKSSPAEGGSPLLGNANNPNMADIPERRKTSATPTVSSQVRQVKTAFTSVHTINVDLMSRFKILSDFSYIVTEPRSSRSMN